MPLAFQAWSEKRVWTIFSIMFVIDFVVVFGCLGLAGGQMNPNILLAARDILGLPGLIAGSLYVVVGAVFSLLMTLDERFIFLPMVPPSAVLLCGQLILGLWLFALWIV